MPEKHKCYIETLRHYICGKCKKWWSVSDIDSNDEITCPHCKTTVEIEVVERA